MPITLEPENEHDRNLGIGWDAEKVGIAIMAGNEDYPVDEEPTKDNLMETIYNICKPKV